MMFVWAVVMAAAPVQSVDGGLSLEQVRDQISWHSPEINACLPKKASVRYRFSVLPNGRVGQLGFVSAQKAESPKITCVGTALEKFRFPAGDGGVVEWEFAVTTFDAGVPSDVTQLAPDELPDRWVDDAAACYDATKPGAKQEGLGSLELVVLPAGAVVSASSRDVSSALASTTLPACLEELALGWSLVRTGQARRLQANFVFASSERRAKSFFVPSAPPRMILANEPRLSKTTEGGLDKNVILREIRNHSHQIRTCYEMGLVRDPKLGGKLSVAWTIGPDGAVIHSEPNENTTGSESVAACVVDVVMHMKFPPPMGGGNVNVTFPWIFKAAGEQPEEAE